MRTDNKSGEREAVARLSINFPMMRTVDDREGPFVLFSDYEAVERERDDLAEQKLFGWVSDRRAWEWQTRATTAEAQVTSLQKQVAELKGALERQCDNMAFVVNHASLYNWHDKFRDELEADRSTLTREAPNE